MYILFIYLFSVFQPPHWELLMLHGTVLYTSVTWEQISFIRFQLTLPLLSIILCQLQTQKV